MAASSSAAIAATSITGITWATKAGRFDQVLPYFKKLEDYMGPAVRLPRRRRADASHGSARERRSVASQAFVVGREANSGSRATGTSTAPKQEGGAGFIQTTTTTGLQARERVTAVHRSARRQAEEPDGSVRKLRDEAPVRRQTRRRRGVPAQREVGPGARDVRSGGQHGTAEHTEAVDAVGHRPGRSAEAVRYSGARQPHRTSARTCRII